MYAKNLEFRPWTAFEWRFDLFRRKTFWSFSWRLMDAMQTMIYDGRPSTKKLTANHGVELAADNASETRSSPPAPLESVPVNGPSTRARTR